MTSTLLAEQSDTPVTPQRVLEEVFGYQTFRDGQQEVIEAAIEGKDSLVIMPTGGGKSLCYQIPALVRSGITLVISPLISLMKDQVDQLKANGVAAELLKGDHEQFQFDSGDILLFDRHDLANAMRRVHNVIVRAKLGLLRFAHSGLPHKLCSSNLAEHLPGRRAIRVWRQAQRNPPPMRQRGQMDIIWAVSTFVTPLYHKKRATESGLTASDVL